MKPNFYQGAVTLFMVGLFGYFVWPTLYAYEDINIRNDPMTVVTYDDRVLPSSTDEDVRIRTYRIYGVVERDLGMGRWIPYVRPPKCGERDLDFEMKPTPTPAPTPMSGENKPIFWPIVPVKIIVPCEVVPSR